jgi:hypothetical protein
VASWLASLWIVLPCPFAQEMAAFAFLMAWFPALMAAFTLTVADAPRFWTAARSDWTLLMSCLMPLIPFWMLVMSEFKAGRVLVQLAHVAGQLLLGLADGCGGGRLGLLLQRGAVVAPHLRVEPGNRAVPLGQRPRGAAGSLERAVRLRHVQRERPAVQRPHQRLGEQAEREADVRAVQRPGEIPVLGADLLRGRGAGDV